MDQPGGGSAPPPGQTPPPPGQTPPPPPPPPQQGWQSTPQAPAPPPPAGGQPGGMPSWTANLTAQGTIAGPGGIALADTPSRVISAVIDFIILGVIGFIVGAVIHPILGERFGTGTIFSFTVPSLLSTIVVAAIMFVVAGAYFVGMWTRMQGATLGMRVLKLAVRDAGTGGPIAQQQAINRFLLFGGPWALSWIYAWGTLGLILSVLVLVYYIYLLVTIAQSPTRQGFHDQYAKTVVAKVAA